MTDDDLVAKYNRMSTNVTYGVAWIRDELWRREAQRSAERIEELSAQSAAAAREMRHLTWVITILTLVNAVAAVIGAIT